MRLRDDERGQSVQIGAVLLFATLIIAFSSYQAFVVPQQNAEVEFDHNAEVRGQLQDLRNVIVTQRATRGADPVSLPLGTRYPSRLVAQNPGPAYGSIRTVGTGTAAINATVANASAAGETGDVWNGSERTYGTGAIAYSPNYNRYDEAPETVYENTVLFDRFRTASRPATDQSLVDGNRISLVTVDGSLDRTGVDTANLDVQSVSTSTRTVSVTNESTDANVTLFVPTQLPRSAWTDLLEPELAANGGHVTDVSTVALDDSAFDLLRVELERDVDYRLRMKKVGVGSDVEVEPPMYLTDTGDTDRTGRSGDVLDIVVEARDAYNNPVPDATVNASVSAGSVSPTQGTTDANGRFVVRYDTSGVSPGTYDVRLSLDAVDGDFDNETASDVTVPVTVTDGPPSGSPGGSAPYGLAWDTATTSDQPTVAYHAGNDTIVVGATAGSTVDVTARATDDDGGVSGVFVDYASGDQSVADFSTSEGRTGSDGRSTVPLTVGSGTTSIYASSLVGTDSLTVKTTPRGPYYRYYEGNYGGGPGYMPDFGSQSPTATGNVSTFDLGPRERNDGFGFSYTASLDVPSEGSYTFYTNSDDGSRLYVDGELVVDNAGDQQVAEESGEVTLSEGRHNVTVNYYENGGEEILDVSWAGPDFAKEEIPSNVLTPRVPSANDDGGGGDDGGGSGGDTTPPAFDSAEAYLQGNQWSQSHEVAFTASATDDEAVDRVDVSVFDSNDDPVGSDSFGASFWWESVPLDEGYAMQPSGITVELTAYDTSGNSRTCRGVIDEYYDSVAMNDGLSCDETST